MKKSDLTSAVVFLVLSILTTVFSLNYELGTFQNAGTGMFPFILGIILIILSVVYLVKLIIAAKKAEASEPKKEKPEPAGDEVKKKFKFEISDPVKQLLFTLGILIFAAVFLDILGFLLTSFIVEIALLKTLKMKNWLIIILTSFLISVLSYVLFVLVLHIILPKGFPGI